MRSNAIEFLKQNQEEILTGILAEILKNYPKWQEIYDYPSETKSDFMPGISTPQELSELLELQNIYILDGAKIVKEGLGYMMPLLMANLGEEYIIKQINGREKDKTFLATLGFVIDGKISVVNAMSGNLIVNVKDSRVAISKELASKIMV